MGRERDREAALFGDILGDDGRRYLVPLKAAVLLGNIDRGEAKFARLFDQSSRHREVLGLDLIGHGHDLVHGELGRRLRDLAMLFREVFGEKTIGSTGIGDQKTSPRDDLPIGRSRNECGHLVPSKIGSYWIVSKIPAAPMPP